LIFSCFFSTVTSMLCNETCGSRLSVNNVQQECTKHGFKMEQNCCYNSTNGVIFGIDLRNCNITNQLNNHFFHQDNQFLFHETFIVDLTENHISSVNDSNYVWAGFVNLNKVFLPSSSFQKCPGGDEFWLIRELTRQVLSCDTQLDACKISAIVCPTHSECKTNGPGSRTCQCEDGFYGYKCRKTGTFPFTMYFSVLLVSTVAVTIGLWFIGRRLVSKHAKLN